MIVGHAGLDAARGERAAVRMIVRAINDGADRDRLGREIGEVVLWIIPRR